MAEIIKVDLNLNFEVDRDNVFLKQEKILTIPEIVQVPQFAVVQWNIKNFEEYRMRTHRNERSLIFTIYFDKESPFDWKRNFVQLYDFPFGPFYANNVRLAEGVAEKKGDYKYGISIFDANQNEEIFDEDPIVRVI
jgi:hypothetical protein